jgi:hypothetical protein
MEPKDDHVITAIDFAIGERSPFDTVDSDANLWVIESSNTDPAFAYQLLRKIIECGRG